MEKELTKIKNDLRSLSENGQEIELTKKEADLIDITNVYDQMEDEGEVEHG